MVGETKDLQVFKEGRNLPKLCKSRFCDTVRNVAVDQVGTRAEREKNASLKPLVEIENVQKRKINMDSIALKPQDATVCLFVSNYFASESSRESMHVYKALVIVIKLT